MIFDKISNHIENPISGDWGNDIEDNSEDFTFVLRTTNFTNIGKINYGDVVKRDIFSFVLDRKRLKKNDIIIEKSGGSDKIPVGRVVFFDIEDDNYICNNFTSVLRCKDTLSSKYLFYYLFRNHKHNITAYYQNKTTGIRNLQLKRYLNTNIPIPPLPQQEKIVKVLDISSALIEKQKELIEEYNLFLKSKFIEMFGDPIKNPMRWEVEKLVNLIEQHKGAMKTGPFGSTLKKEFYVKDGYKIYGQEQVIKNNFNYGNYYIDEERYKTLKGYSIKEKDILISLVGTFGKIAIVPKVFEAGIINPRLMKISLDTTLYNPVFFKDLFYTEGFKAQLLNFSHGGTMGILNLTILKELKYIKPPIELQDKFASIVEKIETIKEQENKKLEHLETLHNSLMDKAFKGEIQ